MPVPAMISVKKFPFFRLVAALTTGIILQWYFKISLSVSIILIGCNLIVFVAFYMLSPAKKFILGWLRGLLILLFFVCIGMVITWQQNIYNNNQWYGKFYKQGNEILLTIKEPLVEKSNSFKALAEVNGIYQNHHWISATGNVLMYFKKDSVKLPIQYGSQIIFNKFILPIQSSGNPAAFDYNRYCLFQNITGQSFLAAKDFTILQAKNINVFQQLLFSIRDWALNTLKQNIHSQKELGIAEALLIGYRNDLDKDLVQAYSNTGVVHIIAISGLHIGLIYVALNLFFSLFKSYKLKKWIEPALILVIIWMFTLIAGAAPSVLRATVMFTFLLAAKLLGKNGNMYNTLAASAFMLLLFNPFYLWDIGFQLSYAAVFSIFIFFKSINGLFYFKNRFLRWIWQLTAVSLSAQIFTLPLVVYHFHQLPLLFLISNLVAVPLSGIILFEELILFCFSWWHAAASIIGWLTEICLKGMNDFIGHINQLSFSVWDGLHISIMQLLITYIIICFLSFWIFSKNTKYFLAALSFTIAFFVFRDADILYHKAQQKIIVYNVPRQTAVDITAGNSLRFSGDSIVLKDVFLRNFNLKPSRIKNRMYYTTDMLLPDVNNCILKINSSKILILNKPLPAYNSKQKIELKVLILSHNINQSPAVLNNLFQCEYFVADSSIPAWKSAEWKKEFEQLHLRFYSVAQDGAFILKL